MHKLPFIIGLHEMRRARDGPDPEGPPGLCRADPLHVPARESDPAHVGDAVAP